MLPDMLALIAKLDGSNGLLVFHVEHESDKPWRYRLRWPASSNDSLREWQREREVQGEGVFFPLVDPNVPVEAQWRTGPKAKWRTAEPHEFVETTADFVVEIRGQQDFSADPVLRVAAMVRGFPAVFDLAMPRRVVGLTGPERIDVVGTSFYRGPGNLLRKPGDFAYRDEQWSVMSAGPNRQAALLSVAEAKPGANEYRQAVVIRTGALSAEEKEELLRWKAQQNPH